MERLGVRETASVIGAVGLLLVGSACENLPGPDELDVTQFSTEISLLELANTLDIETARVELTLYRQGVVIKELEIKPQESLTEDERIEGRVVAVENSEGAGYLELNIEDLRISFDENTIFSAREENAVLDSEAFLARLQAALSEGMHPAVEAIRSAPDAPQSPDDDVFVAEGVRLLGEGEGRILEMNIDVDNLTQNTEGYPDGWITLLGREFEIRIREGITRLKRERPDLVKERFEGEIESVNLDRQSFVLKDGPTVRLIAGETKIRYEDGDRNRLPSLEAVSQALSEERRVFAAGCGVVASEDSHRLVAVVVVFELAPPPMRNFEGKVTDVSLEDSTVTLEQGHTIRITGETEVKSNADCVQLLGSLEAVAEALEAGTEVVTAGVGVVTLDDPVILEAVKIRFVVKPPPIKEFRGVVGNVDLVDSTVTLTNGKTILVGAETEISFGTVSDYGLGTLEAVAEALEGDRTVVVAGVGEVESEDPWIISATRMVFIFKPSELFTFHGVVESVNPDAHTFTLENGTVVRVTEETVVWFQTADVHSLETLSAVAEALENERVVVAAGLGQADPSPASAVSVNCPTALVAIRVAFFVAEPEMEHFENKVKSVDLEGGGFTLHDGMVVHITESTVIVHEHGSESVGSLETVARLVEDGFKVQAIGMGLVESSDSPTITAVAVLYRLWP